jgi:hypothetical protein
MTNPSEIMDEIICIRRVLNEVKEQLDKMRQKRNLRIGECLLPPSICRDILAVSSTGNLINNFDEIIYILANYYSCRKMGLYVDAKRCSEKAIAMYHPSDYNAYSREKTVELHTVLHEWFHHICNCSVVFLTDKEKKDEEKHAAEYANKIIERGNIK